MVKKSKNHKSMIFLILGSDLNHDLNQTTLLHSDSTTQFIQHYLSDGTAQYIQHSLTVLHSSCNTLFIQHSHSDRAAASVVIVPYVFVPLNENSIESL